MFSVRIDGDTKKLIRRLKNISEVDRKGINAALGQSMRESTMERFKQGRGPDGKKWPQSIRVQQDGGSTLVRTARMRNSIHTKSDITGFAVGTNTIYAGTHQFGAPRTIRAKTSKGLRFKINGHWVTKRQVKIVIPARPYLGMSEEDLAEVKHTVEDAYSKE